MTSSLAKRLDASQTLLGLTKQQCAFVIEYSKDYDPRRAAIVVGMKADEGLPLSEDPRIIHAVNMILGQRLEAANIDAEWVLLELVDNHHLARQSGNLSASNKALESIAKNKLVDAVAAKQTEVKVNTSVEFVERLQRGRTRTNIDVIEGEVDSPTEDKLDFG